MTNLTMITGGSKSGKSVFAEQQLSRKDRICYIATGVLFKEDVEMARRIQHHQARRPDTWTTKEQFEDVDKLFQDTDFTGYLLDDATMLTTNLFFKYIREMAESAGESDWDKVIDGLSTHDVDQLNQRIIDIWTAILNAAKANQGQIYIVTNEVGLGLVPATKESRILRDLYGEINQQIAKVADQVYFVVSGIPCQIK